MKGDVDPRDYNMDLDDGDGHHFWGHQKVLEEEEDVAKADSGDLQGPALVREILDIHGGYGEEAYRRPSEQEVYAKGYDGIHQE